MAKTIPSPSDTVAPLIPDTMRAVAKTERGRGVRLITTAVPTIGPDSVLVRVKATTICGTDLHMFNWDPWSAGRVKPPLIIGHELGGVVVALGERVQNARLGDFVSAETHVICNHCLQCRTGQGHVCAHTRILGVDLDGCFAEYVEVPASNLWANAADLPLEWAPIQEPLGNAVHTVLSGDVAGRTVAIIGCGPIGILAAGVARACGAAEVFAVDLNAYRLGLAGKMGATRLIKADEEDAIAAVRSSCPDGVDVICEMSGHPQATRDAFQMIRAGGRFSILGIPSRPMEIDVANDIVMRGITVQGIAGRRMMDTWYQVAQLLNSRQLDLDPMITHRFPLEGIEEAMALMASGNCGKIVLTP